MTIQKLLNVFRRKVEVAEVKAKVAKPLYAEGEKIVAALTIKAKNSTVFAGDRFVVTKVRATDNFLYLTKFGSSIPLSDAFDPSDFVLDYSTKRSVLEVIKLHDRAILPNYQTSGAAAFDLHAMLPEGEEQLGMMPGESVVIRTGLAFNIPAGHVLLIFSRSGHGFNNNVRLANAVGVIDSDYTGEVKVKLTKDDIGMDGFTVNHGSRIAQAMLVEIPQVKMIQVQKVKQTERGANGLGSTGR